jgi:alkanesulfonate monooxygenase SsuD/methylene tetrahydromethanopterin reductase-like flavin-dependent oxidoreductase (luciferase family)
MRCGVFLLAGRFPDQDDGTALARSADAVVAAEAAGFDDAWIAEHHFMPYGVCPSAITFAAHAAGRTNRITVGTAVSVLSTVHPVALAEQVALIDQLSDGRFHLCVGRGGPWVDLEVFGTGGLDRYEHGFAEALDLLLRWLTEERVGADGERFRFREVPVVPRPRTRPHPPVAVACTSPVSVELAAARGLPMLLGLHIDDREKADMVAHYDKAARSAGCDPGGVGHIAAVVAQVADPADARRALRVPMTRWLAEGLAAHVPLDGHPRPSRDPVAYVDQLFAIHPVGDPQRCIDRLHAHAERTGIRHLIMVVEGTGDHDRTLANIARLGQDVLPFL